jgi:hypothetical protein
MKHIKTFSNFLNEKEEKDFEDKIKGHGYYKGISTSTARKKLSQMKDQAKMSDDDPDAYQPLPGDTKGKKLLKTSKHTKDYQELYGDKNESLLEQDSVTKKLSDELFSDLYKATLPKRETSVDLYGTSTIKTFDDGIPVLKYLAREKAKSFKFKHKGSFEVVHDTNYGWFYFTDGNTWYGLNTSDGYSDPSDLPFNMTLIESIKESELNESEYSIYIEEAFSTITATGLSKQNKQDIIDLGATVKVVGPGYYIMVNNSDKKKILDYLSKEGISVNESLLEKASGDRSPIDSAEIEKGLEKKSEETGVPISLLRIVMRRGMAAWKSGHRPGAGQEQWGYARLNSFLTKAPGTWGRPIDDPEKGGPKGSYGADADVAQEVIKGGHDKKLKS